MPRKLTTELEPGDVIRFVAQYVDRVEQVELPTPPAVVAKVTVTRMFLDGRTGTVTNTFFWAGITASHDVADSPLWIAAVRHRERRSWKGTGKAWHESSPMPWDDAVAWVHAMLDIDPALTSGGFREASQ